jgi:hypothetical protein
VPEKRVIAVFLRVHAGFHHGKMGVLYRDFRLELGLHFGESAAALETS